MATALGPDSSTNDLYHQFHIDRKIFVGNISYRVST